MHKFYIAHISDQGDEIAYCPALSHQGCESLFVGHVHSVCALAP